MIEDACKDYSEYIKANLEQQMVPLNDSIESMLARLEECQTMLGLVQQERCNAVGITGALTEAMDCRPMLSQLTGRIDALEGVTNHLNKCLDQLEVKMSEAEEQAGIVDTKTKLKSFIYPLFKMKQSSQEKQDKASVKNVEPFLTEKYFNISEDSTTTQEKR